MLRGLFGRFCRHCIAVANQREAARGWGHYDYMTDDEITHSFSGRGHLIDWNEVRRRWEAGESQSPWAKKAGAAI